MDRGAWPDTVHRVEKSHTRLSTHSTVQSLLGGVRGIVKWESLGAGAYSQLKSGAGGGGRASSFTKNLGLFHKEMCLSPFFIPIFYLIRMVLSVHPVIL